MNDIYAKGLELINRWENSQTDKCDENIYISLDNFKEAYDRMYNYCEQLALRKKVPLCNYVQATAKSDDYYIVEFTGLTNDGRAVYEFDDVDRNGGLKLTTYVPVHLTGADFTCVTHYIVLDGEYYE